MPAIKLPLRSLLQWHYKIDKGSSELKTPKAREREAKKVEEEKQT